jgi:indolepyruvate decarboxylase
MSEKPSIGRYLIDQLHRHGVRHIFGVPGDYVLGFYDLIEKGPIRHVGTTREDSAGFAADAYARINGMGAVCVTYCVGGLSLTNPIAGAYAEKSPVVVISGAPNVKGREHNPLLHHRVRDFTTQREIFSHLTIAAAALEDPSTAYREIDRVIHAVERYKRPGYIELPMDMVSVVRDHEHRDQSLAERTDPSALDECIAETTDMLNRSRSPVILAGVEVHRFGLQDALTELVEKTGIPVATTILGKSVISEGHPYYLGVYGGTLGGELVRGAVESADCVLMLGCFMADINLGMYTARLDTGRVISATSEKTTVRHHGFENVPLRSFIEALLAAPVRRRGKNETDLPESRHSERIETQRAQVRAGSSKRLTTERLFSTLNDYISEDLVVISDIGDCFFGAIDLRIPGRTEFLCPAYYASMGFAIPASIGAQCADGSRRPLVLVGDGAFQMTGMEVSTAVRIGLNPVIVVLNNHGYTTERQIMDGPFNDILDWRYAALPALLGDVRGELVHTVGEFRTAIESALRSDRCSIVEADLDRNDASPALRRIGEYFGG